MIFIHYFIAICHIFSLASGFDDEVRHIKIGGIFTKGGDSELEAAFHIAILHENKESKKFEFAPIVRWIDPNDSCGAEKMACEIASEGVVAIVGPNSIQTSKTVGAVCNELGIPHIVAHWRPEETSNETEHHLYTRNIFPDNNVYSKALAQIVDDYEWKGFTLLYENKDSFDRLNDVLEKHGPGDKAIAMYQLPDDEDYQRIFKLVKKSRENRIVIDCHPDKILKIFQSAFDVKMMNEYEKYIITSVDAHLIDYKKLEFFRANITMIRLMDPWSKEVGSAINDWQHGGKRRNVFAEINATHIKTETALFYDAVQTFLLAFRQLDSSDDKRTIYSQRLQCSQQTKWSDGAILIDKLKEMNNYGITGRIFLDKDGRRTDFYMEILEMKNEGLKKIALLDPQTMKINYTRTLAEVHSQVTESLHNKTFRVATTLNEPFVMIKESPDGEIYEGNNRYEGYAVDVIDNISKLLGFTFILELIADNKPGSFNKETNEWNGLVRHILDGVAKKADLAICDLTITAERRQAVDFTMPFMTLGISILFAKPHKMPKGRFAFMDPLSVEVWLYMATAYLCISILLFILAKLAADDWENPHPCNTDPDELETIWNMHNCIWLTAGSIMQQGCDILPKAMPTRLTAGLWWFFALIVISSYTANLAAFLTMERMDSSIDNVEYLAMQSKVKYGGVKGGSTMGFFMNSNASIYQRMSATMLAAEPSVFAEDNGEGVARVKKEKGLYAFLMESSMIEFHCNRNCNLTKIGGLLDSKGYGIAMPVNSPYRTIISQKVLQMQEDGKLQRLKKKWWEERNKNEDPAITGRCDESKEDGADSLEMGMKNVGGVFIVLAAGLGVSIVIGILEFLWNVSKVSAAEKITQWEAFKSELLFALDVRITTKLVNKVPSEKSLSISNRSSQSLEANEDNEAMKPGWKFNLGEKTPSK